MVRNKIVAIMLSIFLMISNTNADDDKFTINPELEKQILNSPFKVHLHHTDGKEIIAYLYAEDEQKKTEEYYICMNGESETAQGKSGHYYIYLYDINTHVFLPGRTAIFPGFRRVILNIKGTDLFTLTDTHQKKSDVLLISQFGDCNGDFYESYGFSKNLSPLRRYIFADKEKSDQFYGRVGEYDKHHTLIAYRIYGKYNKIYKYSFSLSDTPEEIRIKPEPW